MADLYDAIKTEFDANSTLVTSGTGPFDELHSGEVGDPTSVPVPYCTMVQPSESNEEECFDRHVFVQETFAFQVVDATRELARDRAELVNAAFDKFSLSLSATGLTNIRLMKTGQRDEQAEEDRWVTTVDYMAQYWRRRPA